MKRFLAIFLCLLLVSSLSCNAYAAEIYDTPAEFFENVNIWISLGIGLLVAAIVIGILCYSMNTRRRQRSAGSYLTPGSYRLYTRHDIYLYRTVRKTPRPKDND